MKYYCGHRGCDVCGARDCDRPGVLLNRQSVYKSGQKMDILICDWCMKTAVRIAVEMAETFGGCCIDHAKPCGDTKLGGDSPPQPKEDGR